ncbi:MAG: hypothetical protein PHW83_09575 [Bacteroidales bacterium]|nr:hypothetical protein [Bacteroidales bacterium]
MTKPAIDKADFALNLELRKDEQMNKRTNEQTNNRTEEQTNYEQRNN